MKAVVLCGLFLAAGAAVSRAQDSFADAVVSYDGTNVSASYQNSSAALGAPQSTATITAPAYQTSSIVGIGDGGELTVEFDTPIVNDPADHAGGFDFTIFGNDFFVLGGSGITGEFDHPGLTVWVSQDNINYYELAVPPAAYGADDSFPTEGSGDPTLPVSPSLTLSSFVGLTSAQALSLYDGSAGGASFSISWAENGEDQPVDLPSISYIKVEGGASGTGYVDAFARVQSIPEPGCAALVCGGFAGLVALRRRGGPGIANRLQELAAMIQSKA